jgi:hypothetical protein
MSEYDEFTARSRRQEIEKSLDQKQQAYQEAIRNNQPEVADQRQKEFYDLVAELRFVDPDADLSGLEATLKQEADEETKKHNIKPTKRL